MTDMYIHTVYSSAQRAPGPNRPLAKSTTELSKSQAHFISKVVTKWVNRDRHRLVFKNSQDLQSLFLATVF